MRVKAKDTALASGNQALTIRGTQTISADDVTVTYGDTGASVSVTEPATGGGAISYAVKNGSEDYIEVNSQTGKLPVK